MDHDPRNPAYIATQGPLPSTVADFWQVKAQENPRAQHIHIHHYNENQYTPLKQELANFLLEQQLTQETVLFCGCHY